MKSTAYIESVVKNYYNTIIDMNDMDTYENDEVIITSGCFRVTIIAKNHDVVAKMTFDCDDQCRCEEAVYSAAQKEGLADWFSAPLGSFVVREHTFFAYEAVEEVGEVPHLHSAYREVNWEDEDSYTAYCESQLEYAYDFIEDNMLSTISKFIIKNNIYDLHFGNFGWNKKLNHLVFTDYGGTGC